MDDSQIAMLRDSEDGREIKKVAVAIASGDSEEDHRALGTWLGREEFLHRLDGLEDYHGTESRLRLARVIKILIDNRRPSTDAILLSLIDASEYQSHLLRMQLLIRALAEIRPAPTAAVAYWDRLSEPESPLAQSVVAAICINQTPPALELLEQKFRDPQHEDHLKLVWIRNEMLPVRDDVPILTTSERLAAQLLSEALRVGLVEMLFDYQPDEWYRACEPPKPPERALASQEAQDILTRIGNHALVQLPLGDHLESKVRAGLEAIG
jgi:hypothetical protein